MYLGTIFDKLVKLLNEHGDGNICVRQKQGTFGDTTYDLNIKFNDGYILSKTNVQYDINVAELLASDYLSQVSWIFEKNNKLIINTTNGIVLEITSRVLTPKHCLQQCFDDLSAYDIVNIDASIVNQGIQLSNDDVKAPQTKEIAPQQSVSIASTSANRTTRRYSAGTVTSTSDLNGLDLLNRFTATREALNEKAKETVDINKKIEDDDATDQKLEQLINTAKEIGMRMSKEALAETDSPTDAAEKTASTDNVNDLLGTLEFNK